MIGRERPNPTEEPEVEHRSTAGRNARRQPPELFDPATNDAPSEIRRGRSRKTIVSASSRRRCRLSVKLPSTIQRSLATIRLSVASHSPAGVATQPGRQ